MNTNTTKLELLAAMQAVQDAEITRFKQYQAEKQAFRDARRTRILNEVTLRRRPGILDGISLCESREAASLMWHEFLDTANAVSQKTINKANRLLATLDFPLP